MGRLDGLQGLMTIGLVIGFGALPGRAQLGPVVDGGDRSLGTVFDAQSGLVTGGSRSGGNLFHSFEAFSIGEGRSVSFVNPVGVENILSRVTGGLPTQILGTLGVQGGNANLFLINPNGIVFGPGASLNLGGSFVATTASGVQFGSQGVFSATEPSSQVLLTVSPSALVFGSGVRGGITSNSVAPAGLSPSGRRLLGLQVPDGRSLLLIGGDVTIDGGGINGGVNAQGGRIELGGLVSEGVVGLDQGFRLSFPGGGVKGDVRLVENARSSVRGVGGGDIAVNANNLIASGGGRLISGTEGIGDSGNININANIVSFNGTSVDDINSGLFNQAINSTGNAGSILINSQILSLVNGGQVVTNTFGQGTPGNITINSEKEISIIGDKSSISTRIVSDAIVQGDSNSNIRINTKQINANRGGQISNDTYGMGNAGNIIINAPDINIQGGGDPDIDGNIVFSGILTRVGSEAIGNAGNIQIIADSIANNDGTITASTRGKGDAGNIFIQAQDSISLINSGYIGSSVLRGAIGNGGRISIRTKSLSLSEQSLISASTSGQGNAGAVNIDAGSLSMSGVTGNNIFSGLISVSTTNQGNAGDITINVQGELLLDNAGSISSDIFSGADSSGGIFQGNGDAGKIKITTGFLRLLNGSTIGANSFGQGRSGIVEITAREGIYIESESSLGASLRTRPGASGIGQAGTVQLNARTLLIKTGGSIASGSNAKGDAGSIILKITDQAVFDGIGGQYFTGINSSVGSSGIGRGGDVRIDAGSVSILNNAFIVGTTSGKGNAGNIDINIKGDFLISKNGAIVGNTIGQGNAGDITIKAGNFIVDNGDLGSTFSGVESSVGSKGIGQAGNIDVIINNLSLINGGQILATTSGQGRAGNITVQARDRVLLSGQSSNGNRSAISTETGATAQGNAGNIKITGPRSIQVKDGASLFVGSLGSGIGGDINLTADSIVIDRGTIASDTLGSNGGNIFLTVPDLLLLRRGGTINTNAGNSSIGGNGGNISINTNSGFLLAVPKENSDIVANAFTGKGGNITVNAQSILGLKFQPFLTSESDITAFSQTNPILNGQVTLNTLNLDPSKGLATLPTTLNDRTNQITSSCRTSQSSSTFTVTGKGGLPESPTDPLTSDAIIADWVPIAPEATPTRSLSNASESKTSIVEAQDWHLSPQGEVVLVAKAATPQFPGVHCLIQGGLK